MSNLSEYIEKIKKYKEEHPDISEIELIRYVYMDLGERFSYDTNFIPFGNTKKRKAIYEKKGISYLNDCMESNTITCKTSSQILEHVLKQFGVNIKTVIASNDYRRFPHVYNIITPQDGEPYSVDLQEDIYYIQSHALTRNFGMSLETGKPPVISKKQQENVDRKLGYIDAENTYSDDYTYLLKLDMEYFEKFGERAKFVLEHIDLYDNVNIKYIDRQWHHVKILEQLFSKEEFDYFSNNKGIRIVDCYEKENGNNIGKNCIIVVSKGKSDVYMYDEKEYKYHQVEMKDFAKLVKDGLIIHHNSKVPGLGRALKELKQEEKTR